MIFCGFSFLTHARPRKQYQMIVFSVFGAVITQMTSAVLAAYGDKEMPGSHSDKWTPYGYASNDVNSEISSEHEESSVFVYKFLAVVCVIVIVVKMAQGYEKQRLQMLRQRPHFSSTAVNDRRIQRSRVSIGTCMLCKEQPADIAMYPCGHVCVCDDCSQTEAFYRCPSCDGHFTDMLQVR